MAPDGCLQKTTPVHPFRFFLIRVKPQNSTTNSNLFYFILLEYPKFYLFLIAGLQKRLAKNVQMYNFGPKPYSMPLISYSLFST